MVGNRFATKFKMIVYDKILFPEPAMAEAEDKHDPRTVYEKKWEEQVQIFVTDFCVITRF